ncbi:MAG: 2-oxoisovalerate dehydrogenase E1 subunit beta [Nostoc sp. C3-bin3]|nr:2-oxoisovalerate dehydrogenase E1 subunit beta [Nostoc sp. C3-bin3]
MTEIVFIVEDDPDGGYTAVALTESIFTQADDIETLRKMLRDAVHCHFPNEENRPYRILLKFDPKGGIRQPLW